MTNPARSTSYDTAVMMSRGRVSRRRVSCDADVDKPRHVMVAADYINSDQIRILVALVSARLGRALLVTINNTMQRSGFYSKPIRKVIIMLNRNGVYGVYGESERQP